MKAKADSGRDDGQPLVHRVRDLTLLRFGDGRTLVVACDSSGGIGPKEADTYRASARDVAHFACRVALLEVIAAGAHPLVIVDNLCVEATPTGAEMVREIRRMVSELGLDPATAVTGSTEDNVSTRSTGIGITVIGSAPTSDLRPGSSQTGDAVVCLGLPMSAPHDEVRVGDSRFVSLRELSQALTVSGVHDALPVGSRGVAREVDELARVAGLSPAIDADAPIDLGHPGGPSTCVLVSCLPDTVDALRGLRTDLPVTVVASLGDRGHTA